MFAECDMMLTLTICGSVVASTDVEGMVGIYALDWRCLHEHTWPDTGCGGLLASNHRNLNQRSHEASGIHTVKALYIHISDLLSKSLLRHCVISGNNIGIIRGQAKISIERNAPIIKLRLHSIIGLPQENQADSRNCLENTPKNKTLQERYQADDINIPLSGSYN
jgi:hypothetical protein